MSLAFGDMGDHPSFPLFSAVKFREMGYRLFLESLYSCSAVTLSIQRTTIVARWMEKSSSR